MKIFGYEVVESKKKFPTGKIVLGDLSAYIVPFSKLPKRKRVYDKDTTVIRFIKLKEK